MDCRGRKRRCTLPTRAKGRASTPTGRLRYTKPMPGSDWCPRRQPRRNRRGTMIQPQPTHEPIRFGGTTLGRHRHACAFFNSPEEEDALLLPFLREGLERGERGFCIVDPNGRADYANRLGGAGIPVMELEERGQLELRNWDDAYLRGGHFSQDAMLSLIQEVLDGGRAKGYPLTRLVAH